MSTDALKCEPMSVGDLHFPRVHLELSGVRFQLHPPGFPETLQVLRREVHALTSSFSGGCRCPANPPGLVL